MKHFRSFIILTALTLVYTGTQTSSAYAYSPGFGPCKAFSQEGFWKRETKATDLANKLIAQSRDTVLRMQQNNPKMSRAEACTKSYIDPTQVTGLKVEDQCTSGERISVKVDGLLLTNVWRETRPGRNAYDELPALVKQIESLYFADRERCKLGN